MGTDPEGYWCQPKQAVKHFIRKKHSAVPFCKYTKHACMGLFSCKTSMETNSLEVLRNLLQLLPRAAHSWTHSEKTHTLEYTQMIEFSLTVKNSKTPISPAAKNVSVISSRRPLLCARGHTRAESNNSAATRPPTVWAEMEANWLLVGGLICHHLFCLISLW